MSLITKPISWRLNFKFHLFAHFSLGKAKAQRENQANALALRVEKFWGRPGPSHPFRLQDQPFATRGRHRRDRGLLRSTAGEARLPTAHQAHSGRPSLLLAHSSPRLLVEHSSQNPVTHASPSIHPLSAETEHQHPGHPSHLPRLLPPPCLIQLPLPAWVPA